MIQTGKILGINEFEGKKSGKTMVMFWEGHRGRILIINYLPLHGLDPVFKLFILMNLFADSLVTHGNGGAGYITKVLAQVFAAQASKFP